MSENVSATITIDAWDEQPFDEAVGVAKLTRASVAKSYTGEIDGTSATEWLMAYHPDKTAAFVGLERIKGTIAGRRGSLVLQHIGTFVDGAASADLSVVSGTDGLKSVSGTGTFSADPEPKVTLSLDFA